MVCRQDVYVGQVVEWLKSLGLYDNTLIVFCSDNGPNQEGGADPDVFNSNGIYRGYERDLYEGGIRVPFIVSWPGVITEGQTDFICSFGDMLPPFAELTRIKRQKDTDCISLLPLLTGKGRQKNIRIFISNFMKEEAGRLCVRAIENRSA